MNIPPERNNREISYGKASPWVLEIIVLILWIVLTITLVPNISHGQEEADCPQELLDEGGICLTKKQKEGLIEAIEELKNIHESKTEIEFKESIIIIRDWEDRIYINGGEKKPIDVKMKIGDHVDRDLKVQLPIKLFYREKPPDPWFRLRIRAQLGFIWPTIIHSIRDATRDMEEDTRFYDSIDAGIGWDFFHIPDWGTNIATYTGVRSIGAGVGQDLTKNFGLYAGYSLSYSGLQHGLFTSAYFAFN